MVLDWDIVDKTHLNIVMTGIDFEDKPERRLHFMPEDMVKLY